MSRRFGRNQKRAMRKQIADLAVEVREKAALAESIRGRARTTQLELDNAKEAAVRYSIAFKPEVIEAYGLPQQHFSLYVPRRFSWNEFQTMGAQDVMESAFIHVPLPVLLTDLHEDMRGTVHAIVSYDGGEFGYAVAPRAFRVMPRDMLVKQMAEVIAAQIHAKLTRKHTGN